MQAPLSPQVPDFPATQGEFPSGPATAGLLEQLARAAATDLPVLLEGEGGVGKGRLSRTLHALSPRSGRPFVAACARALDPARFERDFFGEATGEVPCPFGHREGLAALADGGTLLLDEIGELPPGSQAKLARFLDSRLLHPLGNAAVRQVDVRIVSTSRRELRAEVQAGRFRADLYYRLRGILLRVPSLRDRREDLPEIARRMVSVAAGRQGKRLEGLDPQAMDVLLAHPFPGNLRELQNAIERAVARTPAGSAVGPAALLPGGLPGSLPGGETGGAEGLREFRREREREIVIATLEARGWNVSAAARDLGISRVGLCKKIKVLGLSRPPRGMSRPPRRDQ